MTRHGHRIFVYLISVFFLSVSLISSPNSTFGSENYDPESPPCDPNGTATTGTYDDFGDGEGFPYCHTGVWALFNNSTYALAMFGTIYTTDDAGDAAVFAFEGSSITLFYTMATNRGRFSVQINNGPLTIINAYAPDTRRQIGITWNTIPIVRNTITIRSLDQGKFIDIDAFAVNITVHAKIPASPGSSNDTITSDADTLVRYFGIWNPVTISGPDGGSHRESNQQGAFWRLTFQGPQIRIFHSSGPDNGRSAVTIDGIYKGHMGQTTINHYSSQNLWGRTQTFTGLGPGIHIINIKVMGTADWSSSNSYVDFDGFQLHDCPNYSDPNNVDCRAYAKAIENRLPTYNYLESKITFANPTVFSDHQTHMVMWIGGKNWMEVGWLKTEFRTTPYPYAMWFVGNLSSRIILPNAIHPTIPKSYRMEYSGNLWHAFYDGNEITNIGAPIPNEAGTGFQIEGPIRAGGEVTNYTPGIHNPMGDASFVNLRTRRTGSLVEFDWNPVEFAIPDYNYILTIDGGDPNTMRIFGYN